MSIENAVFKLTRRRIRLQELQNLSAPNIILEIEQKLIKKAQKELEEEERKSSIPQEILIILEKKAELNFYVQEFQWLDKTKERTYCPGCKYMYETPNGTKRENSSTEPLCTLHPEKSYEGCEDFEDYGIIKWEIRNKQHYRKIGNIARKIRETRKELSDLMGETSE
jgi:hypothetical protein